MKREGKDPDGLPTGGQSPWVAEAVRRIENGTPTAEERVILVRLTTDPRMSRVWGELTRRRRQSGGFLHPAIPPPRGQQRAPDEAQADALARTLHQAFRQTVDNRAAGKLDEVAPVKAKYFARSAMLRELADELFATAYTHVRTAPEEAREAAEHGAVLRSVATWCDTQATSLRGADDPLTIINSHGDPRARAFQTDMASFLQAQFGNHLHGTAAILTAVALGLPNIPDAAISRSAHLRAEQAQKNGVQQAKIV